MVRCGNCGKTFNSLSHLFQERPEESTEALTGGGMPPMLEHPEMVQAELPVDFGGPPMEEWQPARAGDRDGPAHRRLLESGLWPGVSAVLALVLIVQFWVIRQMPEAPLPAWLKAAQSQGASDPGDALQIVSRDLHAHPSLDDAVVISISLRNQTTTSIDFPVMEVRFYDASQQLLGVRRLLPDEYLHDTDLLDRGLPPGILVPVLIELIVGTTDPAGFQVRFFANE